MKTKTTPQKTPLEKVSDFRRVFGGMCRQYTHLTDFFNDVAGTLVYVNEQNAQETITKLNSMLDQYPAQAKTVLFSKEAMEDLPGVMLPEGKDTDECFNNFIKPMKMALNC